MGIFAQDQWTIKRLTANYGVRLDFLNAMVEAQSLPAGPFTPARNFEEVRDVPNWKDVNPALRRGVRPDRERQDGRQGQHRPLRDRAELRDLAVRRIRCNSSVNSIDQDVGRSERHVQSVQRLRSHQSRREQQVPRQVGCGAIANPGFGQVQTRTTNYDPNLVVGWGVRPDNWEAQVSIQRELIPRVSVYAGYSRRWFGNLQVTTNRAVSNASYTDLQHSDSRRSAAAEQRRHAQRSLRHQHANDGRTT